MAIGAPDTRHLWNVPCVLSLPVGGRWLRRVLDDESWKGTVVSSEIAGLPSRGHNVKYALVGLAMLLGAGAMFAMLGRGEEKSPRAAGVLAAGPPAKEPERVVRAAALAQQDFWIEDEELQSLEEEQPPAEVAETQTPRAHRKTLLT